MPTKTIKRMRKLEEYSGFPAIKWGMLINRMLGGSVVALILLMLGFVLVPTMISEVHAENVSASVLWKSISLTLDPGYGSSGDIDFGEVIPTSVTEGNVGTQKVVKKTIGVTTIGNYYAVYLSTLGDDNALVVSSGDTYRAIPATRGTTVLPTVFAGSAWGFAVPNPGESGSGYGPTANNFAADYSGYDDFLASATAPIVNNLTKTGIGSAVYNTGTWAGVPTSGNEVQIYKNSTADASGFATTDTFDMYYGLMVDADTMAGNYENHVVYTALASTQSLDEVSNNISRDERFVAGGVVETIQIDLTSAQESLSVDDVRVYLVPHTKMVANNFSPDDLTTTDYPECAIRTIESTGASAKITCTMPELGETGSTDVTGENAITASDHTTTVNGVYELWAQVKSPAGFINYISKVPDVTAGSGYSSTIAYIGLQSMSSSGDIYFGSMQQMTPNVCSNTNIWNNQMGENARIYDPSGTTPLLAAGVDVDGVSSFLLEDTRDLKVYKVRRLADGNCWMVQNLDLDLASVGTLTSENTDLNTRASWTPDATVNNLPAASDTMARESERGWGYYDGTTTMAVDTAYRAEYASRYAGHYYNFYAATAESETEDLNDAEDSICAKGWKLPSVYSYRYADSYNRLFDNAYGIIGASGTGSVSDLAAMPIELYPFGHVSDGGGIYQFGTVLHLWEAGDLGNTYTASSENGARVRADYAAINVKSRDSKFFEFSVRCVSRKELY